MPPRPSPAPSSLPVRPRPLGRRLRDVPGGYDLDTLPIHVDVQDGESPVSWLRRLSVRYDTPARDLLKVAGARQAITGTSRVAGRLRNYPQIPQRLGLPADQVRHLVNPKPLAAATATYIETFHRGEAPARPQSRYCPHCLTGSDPHWPDHWQSPLSLICLTHHNYLLRICPDCLQPPQATPAWLTRPVELYRCPSRRTSPGGGRRRLLPWCDTDLSTATTTPAPRDEVRAQKRLHDWAAETTTPATACGLAITHRIGFQALAELTHAAHTALGRGAGLLDIACDPAHAGPGLAAAVHVLDQPDLDSAGDAARPMLPYDGEHAPIAPAWRIERHHYSPLLAAVQLHTVRHQLAPVDQLTFRTGHPAPRYPSITTQRDRCRLRLPEHHPSRPEPATNWVPQTIWPLAVPASLMDCTRPELRGTMLAMCLAKTGSARRWAAIADELGLPPSHATRIGGLLRYVRRAGHWPDVLERLEGLMSLLQQHPPPIDYASRRNQASQVDPFVDAIAAALRVHPSPRPRLLLTRQLWERFTGGDIAHAPEPLRLDPASASYTAYRRHRPLLDADLFHIAHRRLQYVHAAAGPLTWTPRAIVEPDLPDIRALRQDELE